MRARVDAQEKATGRTRFTADLTLPGLCHVALVRSPERHARIVAVDTAAAAGMPGVVGVFTAADLTARTYGRWVRDIPVLAQGSVRFVGERVAAVVATTRDQAAEAALCLDVRYASLPVVVTPGDTTAAVHEAPWGYPRAAVVEADGPNTQSRVRHGDATGASRALADAAVTVDRVYTTVSGHQGYLEPQACLSTVDGDGVVHVWASDKAPYRLRDEIAWSLDLDPATVVVHPTAVGGDFGGKGAFGDAILCAALARLVGRPVRLVLRYAEDLTATNPRHAARVRVRAGCDPSGGLTALRIDATVDGGAYAGFKPRRDAGLHGLSTGGGSYRVPAVYTETTIHYTNSVPRGHMRAPGSPQVAFAVESALDELAAAAGLSGAQLRRRNLLRTGDVSPYGRRWVESRGTATLDAALAAPSDAVAPAGWLRGSGLALYDRPTTGRVRTSLRVTATGPGAVRVEVPIPEAGAGGHEVVRERLAAALGVDRVEVVQVSTADLPYDLGTGGSRVTVGMDRAIEEAARRWAAPDRGDSVLVEVDEEAPADVTSFCVQVADVAVDPDTGAFTVLDLLTAVDVGAVVNPAAHQMQVDGGAVMGWGFACGEDLRIEDGIAYAGSLGEFKLPSTRDVPPLRTVLVPGGRGVGGRGVKAVGELSNVTVAPAVANAIADATGVRLRDLPLTAEAIWAARR